jgi:hypothetical protein
MPEYTATRWRIGEGQWLPAIAAQSGGNTGERGADGAYTGEAGAKVVVIDGFSCTIQDAYLVQPTASRPIPLAQLIGRI